MAFKAGLRKDLNIAWDAKYAGKAPWYQLGIMRVTAGFAAVILLLTGGGGVYAYNNPEVTEGTALYPIKQAIETVEEVAKITPEAKAKFYIKKIERREAEQKVLEKKIQLPEISPRSGESRLGGEKTPLPEEIKDFKNEIKLEIKEKIKIEVAERKIKRTQKSIERTEERLEKTRQVIEKAQSKDIKLRKELKNRAEQKFEKAKKQRAEKTS